MKCERVSGKVVSKENNFFPSPWSERTMALCILSKFFTQKKNTIQKCFSSFFGLSHSWLIDRRKKKFFLSLSHFENSPSKTKLNAKKISERMWKDEIEGEEEDGKSIKKSCKEESST